MIKHSFTLAATLLSTLLATLAVSAQHKPASLLFTPKKVETTRSGSNGTILATMTERAIGTVTPGGAECRYSAEKFAPAVAQQTLLGDEDADGDVHTDRLMEGIQALLVKPYGWDRRNRRPVARTRGIDLRDVYITPIKAPGTNVSGAPGLRPCDSGAIVANGQIEHFITGEQIIDAFGMVDAQRRKLTPDQLRLDAITVDRDLRIYLSFEDDHILSLQCGAGNVIYTVKDGAIVVIPAAAWTLDARGNVGAVAPHRGMIALTEAQVDLMVTNAKMTDVGNNCLSAAVDVDGLSLDPRGGTFPVSFCNQAFQLPNLLFSAESMTGAGVASTRNGGEIANVNGCALAGSCGVGPSTGHQMGLAATTSVGSLDGLVTLDEEPCRFVIGTPNAKCLNTANCEWHIGTNLNVPAVWLYAGNGGLPISLGLDFASTFAMPTDCFPDIFPQAFTFGPIVVPMAADGWGGRTGVLGPFALPAAIAPNGLLAQAVVNVNGRWQLSTPITMVPQ
jgi:hypothetical protein